MALSANEKEHWKNRIRTRIQARIEQLYAQKPGYKQYVEKTSRRAALKKLRLDELDEVAQDIAADMVRLEQQKYETELTMLTTVLGCSKAEALRQYPYYGGRFDEVAEAIEVRQTVEEVEELQKDETGREILKLRADIENLTDTVWLANSLTQIKALWAKVLSLSETEPSTLQAIALQTSSENNET